MGRLILLFTLVPAVELVLLIEIGSRIGSVATVGLIVATGLVGAALARHQGLRVLAHLRTDISEGRLPASPLLDGVIILVAGALLVTPGVLTDVVGLLCLIPGFRALIKAGLQRRFERALREQRIRVKAFGSDDAGPTIDAELSGEETKREEP